MKLYNTLSRKIEPIGKKPGDTIKLYTCGPTVYHYAHIGNLRNVIFNDTLRRTLEAVGYKVEHVMNITDVGHLVSDGDEGDDKLEKGAKREGKSVWEVAQYYIDAFDKHARALNVVKPTKTVRATDAIESQIELIDTLLNKKYAYVTLRAIYFDVSKDPDYGKLSNQKLADKEIAVRSEVIKDTDKKNPQDFALWFFLTGHFKDHQMRWKSPWGEGFPGWHLECSAIIHQELGETIDIHTGGVDHIGTHHTNEIAQSESAYDRPLSRFWAHNEFLHQDGGKMSKSGDETITLDDVVKKGFDPMALRLFYLQSHYRSHADFTWQNLEAAQNRLKKWQNIAAYVYQSMSAAETTGNKANFYKQAFLEIREHLADNLNTTVALANFEAVMDHIKNKKLNEAEVVYFKNMLASIDKLLGLQLSKVADISPKQKQLIDEREAAKQDKNWAKSDQLRDELKRQGIGLRDSDYGTIWFRL